jgi:hypothetical protein
MIFMFSTAYTLLHYHKANTSRNKKQIRAAESHRCPFAFHYHSMRPFHRHTAKSTHTKKRLYLRKSALQQILKTPRVKEYKS